MQYKRLMLLPLLFLDVNRRRETQCVPIAVKTLKFFFRCEDLKQ